MARLRLIHWKALEAAAYLELLHSLKHEVEYEEQWRPSLLREWRKNPPDAFIIDLSRLPSHGMEIAISLRQSPSTRPVPIVFSGGDQEKVRHIREGLPDASYTNLQELKSTLKQVLGQSVKNAIVPKPMMDRYASRTAAQKLGITASSKVTLINPPRRPEAVLGELPAGVEFVEEDETGDVVLCFLHDIASVAPTLAEVRTQARSARLWILWHKKASRLHNGVTDQLVRSHAIDLGLVDYKVCSVDADWTAMLFAAKKG